MRRLSGRTAGSHATARLEPADAALDHVALAAKSLGFGKGGCRSPQDVIGTFAGEGAEGVNRGYSLYTFEGGDSLSLAFEGQWGADGFAGDYEVLAGTGAYEGASGTGKITGVSSPWQGTGIVDIAIDVTLPDS